MQGHDVQTSQPMSLGPPGASSVDGITVRPIRNTPEEAAFAGRVLVEAFEDKFAHSITREKFPTAIKIVTSYYQGQEPQFYSRSLVAELNGRLVGLMVIKFYGDDKPKGNIDNLGDLGCWRTCRFTCMEMALQPLADIPNSNMCLVDAIGVDASARGRGVGKLLLDRAEYEARKEGANMMFLKVMTNNRAKRLYERQGYHITDTQGGCCFKCSVGPPGSYHVMEKQLT